MSSDEEVDDTVWHIYHSGIFGGVGDRDNVIYWEVMDMATIDWKLAKRLVAEAGILIRCPNEGEVEGRKAFEAGKYDLAAACYLHGSACCLGHNRGDWMEGQADAMWEKHLAGKVTA